MGSEGPFTVTSNGGGHVTPETDPLPTMRDWQRALILRALERHHGDKKAAARAIGVSGKTLYNHLERYGLHHRVPRARSVLGKSARRAKVRANLPAGQTAESGS